MLQCVFDIFVRSRTQLLQLIVSHYRWAISSYQPIRTPNVDLVDQTVKRVSQLTADPMDLRQATEERVAEGED